MERRMRVYIAGPFRQGDQFGNVAEAVRVGLRIYRHGHVPFMPHLYGFAHYLCPQSDAVWLSLGLWELQACDCVVRLPGASLGSDAEVERAKVLGMPVFYGVADFVAQVPAVRWEPAEREG